MEKKSGVLGKVCDVPVQFDKVKARIDFIVLRNVPFDLVIGRPTLKRPGGILEFRAEEVRLDYDGKTAVLPMVAEYDRQRVTTNHTDSEDFTSDSEENGSPDEREEGDDDGLVLTIQDHDVNEHECDFNPSKDLVRVQLRKRLAHIQEETKEKIEKVFLNNDVSGSSLYDLRTSSVPYRHHFELTDETPVYHAARRMAPKHNDVVKQEVDIMLKAGIITPASSAWSFPVVIETKKDGTPRFCVDYRVLNGKMNADRFSLPKVQKIFDDLSDGVFFTTLDLFSGY